MSGRKNFEAEDPRAAEDNLQALRERRAAEPRYGASAQAAAPRPIVAEPPAFERERAKSGAIALGAGSSTSAKAEPPEESESPAEIVSLPPVSLSVLPTFPKRLKRKKPVADTTLARIGTRESEYVRKRDDNATIRFNFVATRELYEREKQFSSRLPAPWTRNLWLETVIMAAIDAAEGKMKRKA